MVSGHFPYSIYSIDFDWIFCGCPTISDGIFKTTPSSESRCHSHPRHIRTATSWNLAEWHQHTTFASVSQMSAPPPHFWSWRGWYPRGEGSGGKPSNNQCLISSKTNLCLLIKLCLSKWSCVKLAHRDIVTSMTRTMSNLMELATLIVACNVVAPSPKSQVHPL